jgi:hypothetical protein
MEEDLLDLRQRIFLPVNVKVELAEVRNPTNGSILLGNDECTCCPSCGTTGFEDANVNEALQFLFESGFMCHCNSIGLE